MEKSKVYYTNLRTNTSISLLKKLERLIKRAGIDEIDFDKKFVAIKIHFGEPGNLSFLRPNYAKVLVDSIKQRGGKVFLTDCNTLYVGRRKDALEHMEAAYENGFSPFSTGCHIIIADGLKGNDEVYVPVPNGEYVKEAKIGRAIMDADIIISLNHFKGHESTGFGGAIKNLGMGCGSRAGKMEMHSDGKPVISRERCVGCGRCIKVCAQDAITITDGKARVGHSKCVGCGRCITVCPQNAISPTWNSSNEMLCKKIAEYARAVVHGRPNFHVNIVTNVSPYCDCHDENDLAIIPDIGFFASFDPVALDAACVDAVNRAPIVKGSLLDEKIKSAESGQDYFTAVHPTTNWRACLEHGEKIGLGRMEYELIEVK